MSHRFVASILAPSAAEAAQAIARLGTPATDPSAPPGAETHLAEVRLDAIWRSVPGETQATDDLVLLTEAGQAASVPLLATLRPARQGGGFTGPDDVRLNLLMAAAKAGFAAVDVEADTRGAAEVAHQLRKAGADVVLSHHQILPPSREEGLLSLQRMQDTQAGLHKLAFQGASFMDAMRALELAHAHAGRGGKPSVSVLGVGGASLRALLALAGNHATYGYAPGAPPAVPGQPGIADAIAVLRHWGLSKKDLDDRASWPAPYLAVLGAPVAHSLSPRIHNAALRAAGRQERFGALEVPASTGALRLVTSIAHRVGMVGASVTAPHKEDAARMGIPDEVAKAVGAANCLRFTRDRTESTNTDATALLRVLKPHLPHGAGLVVLGSGGAARAAIWAGKQLGANVSFTSRDPARGQALAKAAGVSWVPWDQRATMAGQAFVQATPIGTHVGDPSPLELGRVTGSPLVVELVYASGPTALQRDAQAAGCTVLDGRTMLLEQAVDAFRFWTKSEPDRKAMEAALPTASRSPETPR